MPRDGQGNIFGIGSRVRTKNGTEFIVAGFMIGDKSLTIEGTRAGLAACGKCPSHIVAWTDVVHADPGNDPYASYHEAHRDTCMADVVQRASGSDSRPGPFKPGQDQQVSAMKIVWGD